MAVKEVSHEIAVRKGRGMEHDIEDLIFRAAVSGNPQNVSALLTRGPDFGLLDESGLLVVVAERGHTEVLDELISAGMNPDPSSPKTGITPLMWAAQHGQSEAVTLLLRKGADPRRRALLTGATGLHSAAMMGHTEIVVLLVAAGAEVDARTDAGTTALMWAARNGHESVVDFLIGAGADVNAISKDMRTAAGLARKFGHNAVVAALEQHGAQLRNRSYPEVWLDDLRARVARWLDRRAYGNK